MDWESVRGGRDGVWALMKDNYDFLRLFEIKSGKAYQSALETWRWCFSLHFKLH